MTNKQQTEPPTVQPAPAPASAVSEAGGPASGEATAPHQISERTCARMQEAYRMIHAIAARSEEEERRNAEEGATKETGA